MNEKQREEINYFFVHVFNQILSWEEHSFKEMGLTDITLRELHVIEAVCCLQSSGENKMSSIAKYLSITPGSLTTSVNTLVKKGYLERQPQLNDRRVVLIVPTPKAIKLGELNSRVHSSMVEEIGKVATEDELDVLVKTLGNLSLFFADKTEKRYRR